MKKSHKTPFVLTVGTTLLTGLASTAIYADTASSFAMNELSSGYMQLAEAETPPTDMKKTEGSCGEAKCGANKKKAAMDGADMKAQEGKCGDKKMQDAAKAEEGKTTDKPMDGTMKAAEGKCGDKKMPADKAAKDEKAGSQK